MKKKKFRHIHRFAYAVKDIGNTPWIVESVYNQLTYQGKEYADKHGYVIKEKTKRISPNGCTPGLSITPQAILAMLRARGRPPKHRGKVLKNPGKGIRHIDEVQKQFIKRVPFWKK